MPGPIDPALLEAVQRLMASPAGQTKAGNIDLYRRPRVLNPDGSISTVNSMSMNEDGREVLIPTVIPSERGGFRVDEDGEQAWQHYLKTGQHLGMFSSPDDATAYASRLHDDYAAGRYDAPGKPTLSVAGTPIEMMPSHAPAPPDQSAAIRLLLQRLMRAR